MHWSEINCVNNRFMSFHSKKYFTCFSAPNVNLLIRASTNDEIIIKTCKFRFDYEVLNIMAYIGLRARLQIRSNFKQLNHWLTITLIYNQIISIIWHMNRANGEGSNINLDKPKLWLSNIDKQNLIVKSSTTSYNRAVPCTSQEHKDMSSPLINNFSI